MSAQNVTQPSRQSERPRHRDTWTILSGLLLGVGGMVWAFSIPGAVMIGLGHILIFYGVARGRRVNQLLLTLIALTSIWLTPYAPHVIELF